MFCTNCGSSIKDTHTFCTKCGIMVRQPVQTYVADVAVAQPAPAPVPAKSAPTPYAEPPLRPGLIKRAATEQEAAMCNAWAKGGVSKKLGIAASILLSGVGGAATIGKVPAAAEVPAMIFLVPVSLASTLTSRSKQRTLSRAAKNAYAIDASGVARIERRGSVVHLRVGEVVFVVPRGHAPKVPRAAGTGETTVSCVVAPGRTGEHIGFLTACGGHMLDTPIPARVAGL